MSSLNPQLADLERQFDAAQTEASSLVDGLSTAQFNWRRERGAWSMSECLLHLNMVGDRYARAMETVLETVPRQNRTATGPFGYGPIGKWILANTEPPPKRTFTAPKKFHPVEDQPVKSVLPTFIHLQGRLSRIVERADGLDLSRIKIPIDGLFGMRFNLFLTLTWLASHQRRHLWQARQVRQHAAFPHSVAVPER